MTYLLADLRDDVENPNAPYYDRLRPKFARRFDTRARWLRMKDDQHAFVDELAARFAFVAEIRNECVHDNGEMLPYLIMGDVTRQAFAWYRDGTASEAAKLRELCEWLETAFARGSSAVQELISLGSLLENPRIAGP